MKNSQTRTLKQVLHNEVATAGEAVAKRHVTQPSAICIGLILALLLPAIARAQGILYVSNLGQAQTGSAAIGSNSWIAQMFITGKSSGGYVLNSVQLLMNAASQTPSGFSVSLYSKTGDPHSFRIPGDSPQSSLGALSGPDPALGGVF